MRSNSLSIKIIGSASPEGSSRYNLELSRERAIEAKKMLSDSLPLPDSIFKISCVGRNWSDLIRLVDSDEKVPSRAKVMKIIEKIKSEAIYSSGKADDLFNLLKTIDSGVPYSYLYENLFPLLRKASVYFEKRPVVIGYDTAVMAPSLVVKAIPCPFLKNNCFKKSPPTKVRKHWYAMKTNMIADILAVPNIGVEFSLGKRFSLSGNWMYAWWDNRNKNRFWRIYGGDLSIRKWFVYNPAERLFTGHHLGIYGGVYTYDFEFGGTGIMGGIPDGTLWDKCQYAIGIEYGYSIPLARHFNMDFSFSVGYLGGKYQKYRPYNGEYIWEATRRMNWIGPTKADISFVWLI